ncbi:hypothetical protein NVV93_02565 [Pseudomonas sp. LS44]|uniref:hypothetical protein n=1 Tax=Pseudomonas sp. LS44 TaxID=1357074 RepID=UPI00215B0930|nr:hypothetical protein [Pseudomonas sp. LS44]UVE18303.1 hypothetical protein NVV93_02565 [Pseudomonas sp. LS44]
MSLRHTRKLSVVTLLAALFAQAPLPAAEAPAADQPASLRGAEQGRYLAELKRLYQTNDERKALLAHCNQLLSTYALRAGYQLGQSQRQDLLYQLSVSGPGELLVREETRAQQGTALAVRNQRVAVFGVDPYIHYECPNNGLTCELRNPLDGSALVTIVRDHGGAEELAKAVSFLIRNVQKN